MAGWVSCVPLVYRLNNSQPSPLGKPRYHDSPIISITRSQRAKCHLLRRDAYVISWDHNFMLPSETHKESTYSSNSKQESANKEDGPCTLDNSLFVSAAYKSKVVHEKGVRWCTFWLPFLIPSLVPLFLYPSRTPASFRFFSCCAVALLMPPFCVASNMLWASRRFSSSICLRRFSVLPLPLPLPWNW